MAIKIKSFSPLNIKRAANDGSSSEPHDEATGKETKPKATRRSKAFSGSSDTRTLPDAKNHGERRVSRIASERDRRFSRQSGKGNPDHGGNGGADVSTLFRNIKRSGYSAQEFPFRQAPYDGDEAFGEGELKELVEQKRVSDSTLKKLERISYGFDVSTPLPERVNDSQVRYPGLAGAGKGTITALIPEAIYESTYRSLQELKRVVTEDYGKENVENFVADNMGWSLDELSLRLTPEQIDSVAMGMVATLKGSAMLVADVTGFGKGRIMATLLVFGIKKRGRALFLSEKANLFSDIWRDISDIGCEEFIGRPFIVNNGATIMDLKTRAPVFPKWKPKEHKKILESGEMPADCRLVLSTYSQFGIKDTNKRNFMSAISEGIHICTDEVQNISRQEANVTRFMFDVMKKAGSVIDASASSGHGIDNLRSYVRIFPWLNASDYGELDRAHQVWAAGESVNSAVREGRILRRETDISGMELSMDTRPAHHSHMIVMQDHFARVMQAFASLDSKVAAWCNETNEEIKAAVTEWKYEERMGLPHSGSKPVERTYYPFSFGGRLNILCTHFITSLMAPMAIDMIEDSIRAGERPVVVLDSTMEAIMRDLMEDTGDIGSLGERGVGGDISDDADSPDDGDTIPDESGGEHLAEEKPPGFRDMLLAVLENVPFVTCRTKGKPKSERVDVSGKVPEYGEYFERCLRAIEEFPEDFEISPLDIIREQIEYRGQQAYERGEIVKPWRVGEISGRKMRICNGVYQGIPASELDRNSLMSRFNHNDIVADDGTGNDITVMLMTRSGSTGASMHDAPQFPGPYKRRMFDVLPPISTKRRLQMYGRTERRGSRTRCGYTTLSTPLPWHYFTLISLNKKMEALAASVSGSTDVAIGHRDLPDFLNRIGDRVAEVYLKRNPSLMFKMRIKSMKNEEEARRNLYYVSTLFRRLAMLPYKEQKVAIEGYMEAFDRTMKNQVIGASNMLPGRWSLGHSWILEHGSRFAMTNVDREPVILARIHRKIGLPSLDYVEVNSYIQKRRAEWRRWRRGELGIWIERLSVREHVDDYLRRFAGSSTRPLEDLKQDKNSAVKRRYDEVGLILGYMSRLEPGEMIYGRNEEGDSELGLVVDIQTPERIEDAFEFYQYLIRYYLPGDYRVRNVTLEDFVFEQGYDSVLGHRDDVERKKRLLDERLAESLDSPLGFSNATFHVLLGSLNNGILASERLEEGHHVSFRTDDGRLRHGVVIPESKLIRLLVKTDTRINSAEAAIAFMKDSKEGILRSYARKRHVIVSTWIEVMRLDEMGMLFNPREVESHEKQGPCFRISLPDNDIYFKRFAKMEWFVKLLGTDTKELMQRKMNRSQEGMAISFTMDQDEMDHFMKVMYEHGEVMFADSSKRITQNRLLKEW